MVKVMVRFILICSVFPSPMKQPSVDTHFFNSWACLVSFAVSFKSWASCAFFDILECFECQFLKSYPFKD